ncbi:MAG: shikimate kinase [Streptococcaceae bacterium]|jgi:shikimate kinase|nr:shikimate kinase [Streptococcaceae bacterium]
MAIILVGFMASGKTSVGQILAKFLNLPWIDLDKKIEKDIGMPIHKFFEEFGEDSFRVKESQLLFEELKKDIVLSTGGGVVIRKKNRKAIIKKSNCRIYLASSFSVLIKRIRQNKKNIRPLAINSSYKELKKLFEERKIWYKEIATLTIQTAKQSSTIVAKEIMQGIGKSWK